MLRRGQSHAINVKRKRVIIFGILAALFVAYVVSIVPNFRRKQTVAALRSLPRDRVEAAARAFAHDRKATDKAVALHELVSGGYLQAEDVRGLEGRDVTVAVDVDETAPQTILIRVRASDGSDIVLLADGSVQRVAER